MAGMSYDNRLATVAHEIGHVFGLHEAYDLDERGCGDGADSIMDGAMPSGGTYVHCDSLTGPEPHD